MRLSDDDVYECQVAQESPIRSQQATVAVFVPPENPVIEGGAAVVEAIENREGGRNRERPGGINLYAILIRSSLLMK